MGITSRTSALNFSVPSCATNTPKKISVFCTRHCLENHSQNVWRQLLLYTDFKARDSVRQDIAHMRRVINLATTHWFHRLTKIYGQFRWLCFQQTPISYNNSSEQHVANIKTLLWVSFNRLYKTIQTTHGINCIVIRPYLIQYRLDN